jgi:hypothetical protein
MLFAVNVDECARVNPPPVVVDAFVDDETSPCSPPPVRDFGRFVSVGVGVMIDLID